MCTTNCHNQFLGKKNTEILWKPWLSTKVAMETGATVAPQQGAILEHVNEHSNVNSVESIRFMEMSESKLHHINVPLTY